MDNIRADLKEIEFEEQNRIQRINIVKFISLQTDKPLT